MNRLRNYEVQLNQIKTQYVVPMLYLKFVYLGIENRDYGNNTGSFEKKTK